MMLIVKPGLLTTLQDAGRAGQAQFGVGRSGAFDAPSHRIANALAGNPCDACVLEITLIGPTLRFLRDAWIAATGAPLPLRIDNHDTPMWAPLRIRAGQVLTLGTMRTGCRAYLAVHGGIEVDPVLGSRSLDVNAGIGPLNGRALRAGDTLSIGSIVSAHEMVRQAQPVKASSSKWHVNGRTWFDEYSPRILRLLPGAHFERLDAHSRAVLFDTAFRVGRDSNRVGVRLEGATLALGAPTEAISEGCVPGTLQLPPSGQPIALGVEGPVSGGYPRIGQIAAVDLPRLAQCRPGDALRFVPCTLADALRTLRERERALQGLEAAIAQRVQDP